MADNELLTGRTKHSECVSHPRHLHQLTPYLSEEAKRNLHVYKYEGGDLGYMCKYFYHPFTAWCVNYLPEWLAPNTITMGAFLVAILMPCVVLGVCFGTSFTNGTEHPIEKWWFILNGLGYFAYRILDEMDGKQARKTGNASPVGLLFDHGLDAYTVGIVAVVLLKSIQIGDGSLALLMCSMVTSIFYVTTIEEYYVGKLYL